MCRPQDRGWVVVSCQPQSKSNLGIDEVHKRGRWVSALCPCSTTVGSGEQDRSSDLRHQDTIEGRGERRGTERASRGTVEWLRSPGGTAIMSNLKERAAADAGSNDPSGGRVD